MNIVFLCMQARVELDQAGIGLAELCRQPLRSFRLQAGAGQFTKYPERRPGGVRQLLVLRVFFKLPSPLFDGIAVALDREHGRHVERGGDGFESVTGLPVCPRMPRAPEPVPATPRLAWRDTGRSGCVDPGPDGKI